MLKQRVPKWLGDLLPDYFAIWLPEEFSMKVRGSDPNNHSALRAIILENSVGKNLFTYTMYLSLPPT